MPFASTAANRWRSGIRIRLGGVRLYNRKAYGFRMLPVFYASSFRTRTDTGKASLGENVLRFAPVRPAITVIRLPRLPPKVSAVQRKESAPWL